MQARIWHNPRCGKSRATLQLLIAHGVDCVVVDYLHEPPTLAALRTVLRQLQLPARELLRSGEPLYRTLGLHDPAMTDEALLAAMAAHPILIERPIVVVGQRAAIGRPPERVLSLLDPAA